MDDVREASISSPAPNSKVEFQPLGRFPFFPTVGLWTHTCTSRVASLSCHPVASAVVTASARREPRQSVGSGAEAAVGGNSLAESLSGVMRRSWREGQKEIRRDLEWRRSERGRGGGVAKCYFKH